jgi:histidinol-phosphate aminotransferase
MRALPQLDDALRITIGTPAENDRLLAALAEKALAA